MNGVPQGPGRTKEGRRIRIGILGCSDIARRRFVPALQKARNASLSVVASRDPEKAKSWYPAADYDSAPYDDLLAGNTAELVYISLPNHLHEEWVLKALGRGKHVICEKPLALSPASVRRLTAYAGQKGLLLYENIMYLHHPQHRRVKEIIAAGAIGRIRELRTSFGFLLQDRENFRMRPAEGGGAFLDQARYPLSAALFFLEGSDYRFNGRAFFRNGLNIAMTASAVTDRKERFLFSIGFEQQYECWYEIIGEKGRIRVDRAYTTPAGLANTLQITTGGVSSAVTVPAADHFTLMLEKVCDTILREGDYSVLYRDEDRLADLAGQVWESCERIDLRE